MSYRLINNRETVQVFGPELAVQGQLCTIESFPSRSELIRTVPQAEFNADHGQGLLASLSTAVEEMIAGGLAIAATGEQGLDANDLTFDAVDFTVEYVPPYPIPGRLTTVVTIPVNDLSLDTQFGSFIPGPTPQEQLIAARDRLAAMATG